MDVKAMAKSKRSHSQHHSKKSYPKPTAKANIDVAAGGAKGEAGLKRASGKNVAEKKLLQSRGAELPSNSDRNFDEDDLDTADFSHHGTDVVKPKSKGADYRYLISEALAQTHSTDYMDVYSSVDDILPDLNQGFGDMLSVCGEAILSWSAADYFIVEDKARPSHEASFLSLNLKSLNEQLAKLDLAQRLFIEPDVLPPELRPHTPGPELRDEGKEPFQNLFEKALETDPIMTEFPQPLAKYESVLKEVVVTSSEVGDNDDDDMDDASLSGLNYISQTKDNILTDSIKKDSSFEVSQAEAELDMLLDSLGETDVALSSQMSSGQPQSLTAVQHSKSASEFDDAIEYRLGSTSNMNKNVSALDDGIDDLLGSTSYMTIQDNTLSSNNVVTAAVDDFHSTSSSKAKLEDDFDSWLETLQ